MSSSIICYYNLKKPWSHPVKTPQGKCGFEGRDLNTKHGMKAQGCQVCRASLGPWRHFPCLSISQPPPSPSLNALWGTGPAWAAWLDAKEGCRLGLAPPKAHSSLPAGLQVAPTVHVTAAQPSSLTEVASDAHS